MASGQEISRSSEWLGMRSWVASRSGLLGSLFSLVFIQVLVAGLGFLTRVKVAQQLGIEAFGELAFGIAVGTYAQMIVLFGLDKSFVRELVHFPERFGELLKASLIVRAGMLVAVLGLGCLIAFFFPEFRVQGWPTYVVMLATLLMAFQLQPVYDAWQESRRYSLYFLVERSSYFLLIWLLVWLPGEGLSLGSVGLLMVLSVSLGLGMQYRWALPRLDFKPVDGWKRASLYLASSSLWIWLATLAGMSIEYMTQIVLKWYAGNEALGGYSAAWLIVRLSLIAQTQCSRLGSERMSRYTRPDSSFANCLNFLLKYVCLMLALGAGLAIPCVAFPEIILKVFGAEYLEAVSCLRILGFYPLLFGPYLVLLQYVIACRLHRTFFALNAIVGLFSVGLSFWFVPSMQALGAAWAVVVSLTLGLAVFSLAVVWHLRQTSRNAS